VLLGRGLSDELITRPKESYRLRRLETEEAIARAGLQSLMMMMMMIIMIKRVTLINLLAPEFF
jgi:hypothetical protein